MPHVGRTAHEGLAGSAEEGLEHVLTGEYGTERQVSARHALGERDEVRVRAELLEAEPGSATPEAGDDLVVDDQDVVGLADLVHHGPVLGRRRYDAAGADHRLAQQCADVLGPVELDLVLDLLGALHLAVVAVGLAPGTAVAVWGAQLDESREERLELGAVHRDSLGARAGHGRAVIRPLPEHDHVLGALAFVAPVLARHLHCGLDRLAATECEEHMVEVAGSQLGHLVGQLDGRLVGDLEDVVDRELLHLGHDGVVDLPAPVTHIDGPETGEGVDVLVTVAVPDERTLSPLHDDRAQPLHLREGRPQVLLEELVLQPDGRCLPLLSHASSLSSDIHPGGTLRVTRQGVNMPPTSATEPLSRRAPVACPS